jgi:hypothetical protein
VLGRSRRSVGPHPKEWTTFGAALVACPSKLRVGLGYAQKATTKNPATRRKRPTAHTVRKHWGARVLALVDQVAALRPRQRCATTHAGTPNCDMASRYAS